MKELTQKQMIDAVRTYDEMLKVHEDFLLSGQKELEKRSEMIRELVEEIVELKRLLNLAIEDLNGIGRGSVCDYLYDCPECPLECGTTDGKRLCRWKHADEAEKLLKEDY